MHILKPLIYIGRAMASMAPSSFRLVRPEQLEENESKWHVPPAGDLSLSFFGRLGFGVLGTAGSPANYVDGLPLPSS